jgi:hypothetical protein
VGVREICSGSEMPLILKKVLNHCCSLLSLLLRNSALTGRCWQKEDCGTLGDRTQSGSVVQVFAFMGQTAQVWPLWPPVCVSASQHLVVNTYCQMCLAFAASGQSPNDLMTDPRDPRPHCSLCTECFCVSVLGRSLTTVRVRCLSSVTVFVGCTYWRKYMFRVGLYRYVRTDSYVRTVYSTQTHDSCQSDRARQTMSCYIYNRLNALLFWDAIKLLDTRLHNAYRIVATKTVRQILKLSNFSNILHNRQICVIKKLKKTCLKNAVLVPSDNGRTIVIWNWQLI